MKTSWGLSRLALSVLVACAILGPFSVGAATLEWNANPESDNIAFYTVYVESPSGTTTNEVHDGTRFNLDALLPTVSYTLFVTATSATGLESDRSEGMPYILTVGAPSISTHPANVTLPSGNLLSLSVSASGTTSLTYQWRKNGQPVPGATSTTLIVTNASVADSGTYTVLVTNSGGSVESNPAQVIIQVPPAIHTQPQSAGIPIGTEMLLSLGANGTALRYQWFKGAQAIAGQTNSTLRITSVTASDQANYRATVSNLVGSVTSDFAVITILYPPSILSAPASTNLAAGGTIQLAVTATGTAPFSFQWLKNDQPIPNATAASLIISSATVNNSGAYRVRVSNVVASITSAVAQVSVLNAPVILTQPASKDVLDGSLLELTVAAQGSATLSYQWFLNNTPVTGATSPLLRIATASTANAGNYKVIVSNAVGSVESAAATIRVLPRITILQQPVSTNLQPGATLLLSVQATGPELLTYQWFRNGQPLPGATAAQLQIAEISLIDAGSYTVRITSSLETITSATAQVTILQVPPTIISQPLSAQVALGAQHSLSVSAEGPNLSYQWLKNDVAIPGATQSTFALSNFTSSDQGTYRVTISNPFGSLTSEPAVISLIAPPVILASPASTNLAAGGTIQLLVEASGTQPFTFEWFKNGVLLASRTNQSLTISSATTNDSGAYHVRVANPSGFTTSALANILVLDPPTIVTQPIGGDLLEGSRLALFVVASGSGPLSYQWSFNGAAIPGATNSTFEIAAASIGNTGSYTLRVSNLIGSVTSGAATIRVLPRITILQQPVSTNLQLGAALFLSVQATGPAPLSYQWLRSGQALPGATAPQLQIAQVSSIDAGSYTVRISSSVETITSSAAQVTILQAPPTIISQPRSAQVALGTQHILTVSAEGTDLTYQWLKNDVALPGATAPTLALANVTTSDLGTYRVTVSNPFGSVTSDPAVISYIAPPIILASSASTNLAAGGTIQLLVEASGTQPFTFEWFKNDVLLAAQTNQSLTISSATTNDSGAYHVRVANPSGFATSTPATVAVLNPPGIITQPLGGDLLEGSRLALFVVASGSGPLSYQWSFNGTVIPGATNSTFEIAAASLANTGSYTVRVSNPISSATSTVATIRVLPVITIVQQPVSTNLSPGTQLRLTVQATGPAPLTYQWMRNGTKLGGKTAAELIIANTTTSDSGNYTVEISSIVQKIVSAPAQVSISTPPAVTDCALAMATAPDGSLRITGIAPANTTYELQRTDSLTLPRWRRVQNVTTKADGTFEIILSTTASNTGFIRTIRR